MCESRRDEHPAISADRPRRVRDHCLLGDHQVVVRVRNGTREEERISVSFNVMFSSFAGQLSKPLW